MSFERSLMYHRHPTCAKERLLRSPRNEGRENRMLSNAWKASTVFLALNRRRALNPNHKFCYLLFRVVEL